MKHKFCIGEKFSKLVCVQNVNSRQYIDTQDLKLLLKSPPQVRADKARATSYYYSLSLRGHVASCRIFGSQLLGGRLRGDLQPK
jgi:hypothetical protein